MPRPKGSKNKPKVSLPPVDIETVDEQIAEIEGEISALKEQLAGKKEELKNLRKSRIVAEKASAEQKSREAADAILAAYQSSGKSLEEALDLLRQQ